MGKNLTEMSTVYESQNAEIRNTIFKDLKAMSMEKRGALIANLEKVPREVRDIPLSVEGINLLTINEILGLAKLTANGQDLPIASGPKETFHLEAGHKPDIWENIDSIDDYVTIGLLAGYYAASAFIPRDLVIDGSIAITTLFTYRFTGSLLRSRFQTAKWYQRLFPLNLGILRGRNATMVNNIESTFNSRNEVDHLLAIVGALHIPEMKLLLERKGYKSIPLPETAQMQMQDLVDAKAE